MSGRAQAGRPWLMLSPLCCWTDLSVHACALLSAAGLLSVAARVAVGKLWCTLYDICVWSTIPFVRDPRRPFPCSRVLFLWRERHASAKESNEYSDSDPDPCLGCPSPMAHAHAQTHAPRISSQRLPSWRRYAPPQPSKQGSLSRSRALAYRLSAIDFLDEPTLVAFHPPPSPHHHHSPSTPAHPETMAKVWLPRGLDRPLRRPVRRSRACVEPRRTFATVSSETT